jgi:peptidoglycan/LPS O-acetylase OafA/YrhL
MGEIKPLTGLRGLAALLVVIGHFSVWTIVGPRAEAPAWIAQWGGAGGIGMSIFFTLSGFVIALNYSGWDWHVRPIFNLARFGLYRFARLYPAFLLFAVAIVLRTPTVRDLSDPETQRYVVPHLLLLQSWLPVKFGGQLVASDAFHISWSLSAEAGLYLLFGLGAVLAAALPRWPWKAAILTAALGLPAVALLATAGMMEAALAPAGWTKNEFHVWLFAFSPWGVAVQFGFGVVAYRLSIWSRAQPFMGWASDIGMVVLTGTYALCAVAVIQEHVTQSIFAALATGLLMMGARSPSVANRLLATSGIVYLGTISYSLYLFHFIAGQLGFAGALDRFSPLYSAANFAFALAMAILMAIGAYRFVEVPGRRAVRSAADRLLGIQRVAPIAHQGRPAE